MPLCRCIGEVIVLSGLIFLMKGLWAGFSEHWLAGSIAAWLAAAGLDVLEKEPMEEGDPLLNIQDSSKLIITPHIAWATCEARKRCADEVCENIRCYLQGISRNVVSGGKKYE